MTHDTLKTVLHTLQRKYEDGEDQGNWITDSMAATQELEEFDKRLAERDKQQLSEDSW